MTWVSEAEYEKQVLDNWRQAQARKARHPSSVKEGGAGQTAMTETRHRLADLKKDSVVGNWWCALPIAERRRIHALVANAALHAEPDESTALNLWFTTYLTASVRQEVYDACHDV